MSAPPDPDLAAPKDPAADRPRSVLGASFWAMIAFGLICVLAGAGIWSLAPRLLPQRPAGPPEGPRPAPAAAPLGDRTQSR
ncbi:hypothetical protein [Phenylobacterium sp.]|uniref:hypothetical protein n=1 Tax=Phenylobacterium sp. TaxID=1871053 RepID=UPI002614AC91|nr:hypothetical protein [Phenylobacterium sp.]